MKEVVDDLTRRIQDRGLRVRERRELLGQLEGSAPGDILKERLEEAFRRVADAGRRLVEEEH